MHAENYLYRDLKPENLLIDRDGYIKVVDFGFAKLLNGQDDVTKTFLGSCDWYDIQCISMIDISGTPEYMAPELVQHEHYNKSVDYWALGVLLFEMKTGVVPFSADDEDADDASMQMYRKIAAGLPPVFPDGYAQDFRWRSGIIHVCVNHTIIYRRHLDSAENVKVLFVYSAQFPNALVLLYD